jgi:hypothetical protein
MYLLLSYRKLAPAHFVVSKAIQTYHTYFYIKQSVNVTLYRRQSLYLNFTQISLSSVLNKIRHLQLIGGRAVA